MTVDFQKLQSEVSECRSLLLSVLDRLNTQSHTAKYEDDIPIVGVEAAAKFLGIAPQTVYQRTAQIPHTKRFGRLYFNRRELIEYINAGKEGGNS